MAQQLSHHIFKGWFSSESLSFTSPSHLMTNAWPTVLAQWSGSEPCCHRFPAFWLLQSPLSQKQLEEFHWSKASCTTSSYLSICLSDWDSLMYHQVAMLPLSKFFDSPQAGCYSYHIGSWQSKANTRVTGLEISKCALVETNTCHRMALLCKTHFETIIYNFSCSMFRFLKKMHQTSQSAGCLARITLFMLWWTPIAQAKLPSPMVRLGWWRPSKVWGQRSFVSRCLVCLASALSGQRTSWLHLSRHQLETSHVVFCCVVLVSCVNWVALWTTTLHW